MRLRSKSKASKQSDAGAALLIAIFALMLISVVAIALVVSTGTDSALAGNYRTASGAYYAAVAGLEEARGRLLWKNASYINSTNSYSSLLNTSGLPTWGLTQVVYIINPAPGETVDPAGSNYPDTEYGQEFSWGLGGANVYPYVTSVSPVASPSLTGPSYKWVRINPVTEQSLKIDVNGDGVLDPVDVLYYDAAYVNPSNPLQPAPSLRVGPPPSQSDWVQALEITAYAVLPSGGTRLLQYVVAPLVISPDAADMNFPAALTLDDGLAGNGVTFTPPSGYQITGTNPAGCTLPPTSVAPIGYTSSADSGYLSGQASQIGTTASLVSLRQSWLTPASLDAVMQDIVNSADIVLGPVGTYFTGSGPNFTGSDIWNAAPTMSNTNPMTIVVNGNLTLNGSFGPPQGGFGLLLVTGTLYYHPSASWNGLVLVVGQGNFQLAGHHGTGGITGSLFVAQTRNSSGNFLPNLAASFVEQFGGAATGAGIGYDSCWIQGPLNSSPLAAGAYGPVTYKVLSFHEIPTS